MNGFYKLEGRKVVSCSTKEFAKFMSLGENKRVAEDFVGDMHVSTVFLGMNHNIGRGRPLFFETMIFGGGLDQMVNRCSTYDEAEGMHKEMVEFAKDSLAIEGERVKDILQISHNDKGE